MAKTKKSFFERIIGSSRDPIRREDEDDESKLQETSPDAPAEEDEGELTVDVFQTPNDIIIRTMVAGVQPEDLEIVITRDMVTVRGKRETERSVSDENYFFRELYWGSFSRTILLPQEIEPDDAEATERHGLITIKLPKVNRERQTKLKVKSTG